MSHKTVFFERCKIISYYDLNEFDRKEMKDLYESEAKESLYIYTKRGVINVGRFLRISNPIWDGGQHITNVAAEYVKFDAYNDECIYCVRVY